MELLGVIVILGIVALIAVPAVNGVTKNIKRDLCESKLKNAAVQAEAYAFDTGTIGQIFLINLIKNKYLVADEKWTEETQIKYVNPVDDANLINVEIYIEYNANSKKYSAKNLDTLKSTYCNK